MDTTAEVSRIVKLEPEQELRIEVDFKQLLKINVTTHSSLVEL